LSNNPTKELIQGGERYMVGAKRLLWEPSKGEIPSEKEI